MKQRIVTAFVLGAMLIGMLFYTSESFFAGTMVIITLLAAWEWTNFMGLKTFNYRLLYLVIILLMLLVSTIIPPFNLMLAGTIWWIIAMVIIAAYLLGKKIRNGYCLAVIGILLLVPCWAGLNILRDSEYGPWLLLWLILIVSALDSGAYFTGTWLGKHKLMPTISPKKTIEGFLGGIVLALIVAYAFAELVKPVFHESVLVILGVVLLLAVFSLLGDLFESMFKRAAHLKDSGKILPGHGGVLDRIDSYTAAVPLFVLLLLQLGYLH